jgi:hypothetical protein
MRAAVVLGILLVACSSKEPPPPRDPPPPFRHGAIQDELIADAEAFSFVDGDWLEDLGDAPFYGLAFYAHTAKERNDPSSISRADAARARAKRLITNADLVNGDLQEMVTSTLGLIDAMSARGDKDDLPVVDEFLDRLDQLVSLIGWYIEVGEDRSWALQTYGPTSISALVGLTNLQYALLLGGDRKDDRVAWAKEMASHIEDHAFNGTFYEFGLGKTDLFVYPNVAMIAMNARLFQVTNDVKYKDRARALYDAIQPAKLPTSPVRYYSQYSAATMGAKTRDYSTLSEHNYITLALLLLYQITNDRTFVDEADSIFDAMTTELYGGWCLADVHKDPCSPACAAGGVCLGPSCAANACNKAVLHHWIDGRQARPTDPSFMCSGCNLQLLYGMWFRRTQL